MQVKMMTKYVLRLKIKKADYYRLLVALEQHKDNDKNFSSDDRACLNYMYERYKHVMSFDDECYIFINDSTELILINSIVLYEGNHLFKNSKNFVDEVDTLFNKYYWVMNGD